MKIPVIYADWVECLDQFNTGTNDEELVLLMEQGTIEWSQGVAERLTQRLYDSIEFRLRRSADQLQKELNHTKGNESALVKALLSARKRLALLKRVAELQAFPENVRETMVNVLVEYAKSTQQSLEDSALSDRTGRLRSLIKNNVITQFGGVENVFGSTANVELEMNKKSNENHPIIGQKKTRRRVLLP